MATDKVLADAFKALNNVLARQDEILTTAVAQVYALVETGHLSSFQIRRNVDRAGGVRRITYVARKKGDHTILMGFEPGDLDPRSIKFLAPEARKILNQANHSLYLLNEIAPMALARVEMDATYIKGNRLDTPGAPGEGTPTFINRKLMSEVIKQTSAKLAPKPVIDATAPHM